MRTSNYVHYVTIPQANQYFLVHGYTGAVDRVNSGVVRFLLDRRDSRPSTHVKDEKLALESIEGKPCEEPSDETIKMLFARGYITYKPVDEEREYVRELARRFHDGALIRQRPHFLFIPTYECNLRCPYCFEADTRIDLNKEGRLDQVMSEEMADAAFLTMDKLIAVKLPDHITLEQARQGMHITFYGGEPLQTETKPIVEYIMRKGAPLGMTFSAITNAVDLKDYKDLLGPNHIRRIQVTLDGPKDIHDVNRIGPKHRHTYDTIMENIELAVNQGTVVTIRLHTDWRSVDRTTEILAELDRRELMAKNNFSIYITPRHMWHIGQSLPIYPNISSAQLYEKVKSSGEDETNPMTHHMKRLSVPDTDYVERKLQTYLKGGLALLSTTVEFCTANTGGMHLLDPYGDIYSCWDTVGEPDEKIGTYSAAGVTYLPRAKDWSDRNPADIPQCSDCKYVMFHFGGCAGLPVSMGYGLLHPACFAFQDNFITKSRDYFGTEKYKNIAKAPPPVMDAPMDLSPTVEEQIGF